MTKTHRFLHFHISFIHTDITHRNYQFNSIYCCFFIYRTISIQHIEPYQYNKEIIYTETDRYTSYKNIDIQKTGFQMQAIMFNYSNIRKPVKYT